MKFADSAYCPACGGPSMLIEISTSGWPRYRCEGGQQDGTFVVEAVMMKIPVPRKPAVAPVESLTEDGGKVKHLKLKFFCNHGEIDCPKCQPEKPK